MFNGEINSTAWINDVGLLDLRTNHPKIYDTKIS